MLPNMTYKPNLVLSLVNAFFCVGYFLLPATGLSHFDAELFFSGISVLPVQATVKEMLGKVD